MTQEQQTSTVSQQAVNEATMALLAAIETALNQYIHMDSAAADKLTLLAGKVIAIELQGWDFTLYLLVDSDGMQVMSAYAGKADTIIKGSPVALFNLSQGDTTAASLREQNITIDGDLELGQQFSQFFKQLDIDWEERLAQLLAKATSESNADFITHKFSRAVGALQQWQQQAKASLEQNVAEYLLQESRILPERKEMEPFFRAVDTLRNDVDRLEARIQRLQLKASSENTPAKK